jgi:hypothetical protein
MEQHEIEFTGAAQVEKPDVGESFERVQQRPGTDIDDANLDLAGGQGIEHFHLIGRRGDINYLGDLGKEPLQGSTWKFGIEGARRNAFVRQIVEQGPRDRGLADAALVGAHQENHRFH